MKSHAEKKKIKKENELLIFDKPKKTTGYKWLCLFLIIPVRELALFSRGTAGSLRLIRQASPCSIRVNHQSPAAWTRPNYSSLGWWVY